MGPLVSVVIPCYNGSDFIAKAIESTTEQTYGDLQIVVVDDASTDDSLATVKSLSVDREMVVVERDSNGGISAARNTGINRSDGKYIAFLDQDDVMYPEKIERQVSVMESNPEVGITYTDMDHIDESGDIFETRRLNVPLREMDTQQLATYLFRYWENDHPLALTSELIRADLFDTVGHYDEKLHGVNDRDILVRSIDQYDVAHINEVLMAKRFHKHNASDATRAMAKDRQQMTRKMIDQYPFLETHRAEREANIQLTLAKCELQDRNLVGTWTHLGKALKRAPKVSIRRVTAQIADF